jgi:hypothetical protein
MFAPAKDLSDWLTRAEAAADGNPSIRRIYSSSLPGQKANYWVSYETLALVVRDLYAYPFEPDPVQDSWLTPTVVGLAEAIDSRRSFDVLPILGDALEDAGCSDEHVLGHCRHESCHFRGCWVLDALLRRRSGSWRDLYRASDRVKAAEIPPEVVLNALRPGEEFPGGPFLVGDEEDGYVIAAWHRKGEVRTLTCDDDPFYFAATEHLFVNGAMRFSSYELARSFTSYPAAQ